MVGRLQRSLNACICKIMRTITKKSTNIKPVANLLSILDIHEEVHINHYIYHGSLAMLSLAIFSFSLRKILMVIF